MRRASRRIAPGAARTLAPLAALFALLASPALAAGPGIPTNGPDLTVSLLWNLSSWGSADGFAGYSIGTTACNIGNAPVNWCDNPDGCGEPATLNEKQHPVIAQAIYRLTSTRIEQVGAGWLKHGFASSNSNEATCRTDTLCQQPPLFNDQLGVGCNDTYLSSQNGTRPLGMRSQIFPTTGGMIYPPTAVAGSGPYAQRIKVATAEIDPAQNADASWFAEAHYISDNDAQSGNGLNNASYQAIAVTPGTLDISLQGTVVRERSALHAWKAADAAVEEFNADLPGSIVQRFEVARKVSGGPVTWHYEFAIRNMNSIRAARRFAVDFPDGTAIANAGFRDVDSHSGEPYSTVDWTATATPATGTVSWATETFAANPNANALRWSTMYNFWFDAEAAPGSESYTLEMFQPGAQSSIDWAWPLFSDGFEANNVVAWSAAAP